MSKAKSDQATAESDVAISVNPLDADEQYQRLENTQSLLRDLGEVVDELRFGEHRQEFVTAVLSLSSAAIEVAVESYSEQSIAYSQRQRRGISEALKVAK